MGGGLVLYRIWEYIIKSMLETDNHNFWDITFENLTVLPSRLWISQTICEEQGKICIVWLCTEILCPIICNGVDGRRKSIS
jgi:hypothetical protein